MSSTTTQIAKQLRDVYLGKNWTAVNLKDTLAGLTWQQAVGQVHSCNSIVALVFHMNYYVGAALKVLSGGPLDAHDKYSFDHPPINSQADWEQFLDNIWLEVEALAVLIEQMPEAKLWEDFSEQKYGNYYRNLHGIVEHAHYHLGQVVLVKKIILQQDVT